MVNITNMVITSTQGIIVINEPIDKIYIADNVFLNKIDAAPHKVVIPAPDIAKKQLVYKIMLELLVEFTTQRLSNQLIGLSLYIAYFRKVNYVNP